MAECAKDAPLPIGMGLRVQCRDLTADSPDGMHEFDQLDLPHVRAYVSHHQRPYLLKNRPDVFGH